MARRGRENPIATLGASFKDAYEDLRNEYRIGKTGRFLARPKGVLSGGSNADYHWRDPNAYFLAMERARYWDRNNLVVSAGVNRVVENVFGEEGPTLNPQTQDKDFNALAREKFYEWANDPDQCDITGQDDFWQLSALVFRSCLVDGDQLGLPLVSGELQVMEAHRLRTPSNTSKNVVLGVLLSAVGKPLEYWVTKEDIGVLSSVKLVSDMRQIAARDANGRKNVFHPRMRRRVSQTRGVTPLAPVADAIGMHDDLQFATLVKAQVAACFSIIREIEASNSNQPTIPSRGATSDTQLGARTTEERTDSTTETLENIAPGMDIRGRMGEKIKGFSPNIPNPEFFPHAALILSFIAINLGLPLQVLMLDPTKTNFSGWRGAVDQARQGFRRLQKWFAAEWLSPTYEWKLRQFAADDPAFARAMDRAAQNSSPFKHEWQSPGWKYIQPLQDGQADHFQITRLLNSPRRVAAESNRLFSQIVRETAEDNAEAIGVFMDTADEFNTKRGIKDTPKEISWRDIMRLPTPDTVSMKVEPETETPSTENAA